MRIQATVKLTNRDVNMSTKPVRTSIALGKKPLASSENSSDPKVFMMLCTAANRAGTKFSVCGNIDRVFDKFLDQGKCTIQLIKPAKTIFISDADPLQVKCCSIFLLDYEEAFSCTFCLRDYSYIT